eukprot:m.11500 g.11500  ORF g.11500 m.11500 type:complete len:325 (+) comp4030_c0_seq1:52-1026(+)
MKGAWTNVAVVGEGAIGRSSHTLTCCDGVVFALGGEDKPRVVVPVELSVVELEGLASPAAKAKVLPTGMTLLGHAAEAVQGRLYVFGGRVGGKMGEGPESNAVLRLVTGGGEPPKFEEVAVTGDAAPCARSFHATSAVGASLFVYGGVAANGRKADLWRFDVGTLQWHVLCDESPAGVRGGAVLFSPTEDVVYVMFGFNGGELGSAWRYDVGAGAWTQLADPPTGGRSVVPHAASGNRLVVFGGESVPAVDGHAGAGSFHPDTWVFEYPGETWVSVDQQGDVPEPRGWCQMAALDANTYAVYGGLNTHNQRLADIKLLRLQAEE